MLAGGASTRMGVDKALLRLGGTMLIERSLGLLRSLGFAPEIVGSREDLSQFAPIVPDRRAGCGPLSGIEAGLLKASPGRNRAIFIPVDAPLLPPGLLLQMLERGRRTHALATIPRSLGQEQPLCAIYDRRLLPAISSALDAGDYKVMRVIRNHPLSLGDAGAVDCYDIETVLTAGGRDRAWPPAHRVFLNCNTPAEMNVADAWSSDQELQ